MISRNPNDRIAQIAGVARRLGQRVLSASFLPFPLAPVRRRAPGPAVCERSFVNAPVRPGDWVSPAGAFIATALNRYENRRERSTVEWRCNGNYPGTCRRIWTFWITQSPAC